MDPAIQLACRIGLAVLFALAAMHKLRDFGAFRDRFAAYRVVPDALVLPLAALLPGIESAIAVALVVATPAAPAAVAAAVLLAVYSVAIVVNLARGRADIDCGCGAGGTQLSAALVARNGAAILVALAALPEPATRTLLWVDGVTIVGAVACGLLLFHAAGLAGARERRGVPGWQT